MGHELGGHFQRSTLGGVVVEDPGTVAGLGVGEPVAQLDGPGGVLIFARYLEEQASAPAALADLREVELAWGALMENC